MTDVKIDWALRDKIQKGTRRNDLLEAVAELVEVYRDQEVKLGAEPLQGIANWQFTHDYAATLAAEIARRIRSMKA